MVAGLNEDVCTVSNRSCTADALRARIRLGSSEIGVEVGDGFDAAEIVFKGDVLIGGVRVFVGEAETNQDARHFEGVIHLGYEGNGTAFANEHGLSAEAFLQRS